MIDETIILLTPFEDCSHRLSKHIMGYLTVNVKFDLYWYKPLQRIFSKVIVYDYLRRTCEVGVKGANEEIIDLVKREHPKYVLWLAWQYEFRESTFDVIRREGTIVISWFGDDFFRFDNYCKWWIPYLDYCITSDIEAVAKYRELGAKVIYTPGFSGIAVDRDWSNIKEEYDVSFVGSRTPDREQYINELKNRNISLHLAGRGWGKYVSYVPFEEMIDIFGSSKINLNFSWFEAANKMVVRGRVGEVCLAGGFLLTEYFPGIENYFEIDKEIVCFKNAEEMIDKIKYYLTHESERRAIARAGWERATRQYTSFHLISNEFCQIEEDIAAKNKVSNRHPPKVKMPMQIRMRFSGYYLIWGMAFLLQNDKGLWKDALALSISYNPFSILARGGYIIGFLPLFMRSALINLFVKLHKALPLKIA